MSERAVCTTTVNQTFQDSGLATITKDPLEQFKQRLPDTGYANNGDHTPVPFNVYGDPDAPNILVKSAPYLTKVDSPHYQLRLFAQQEVLGDEYCVVGVQAFDETASYGSSGRRKLARGDFSPLSERVLRVAGVLGIENHQRVIPEGYSLGGDVAIQLAHDLVFDENRGEFNVSSLAATEYARWASRGPLVAVGAMGNSGKDLHKNVIDSSVPALLEAWDIDQYTTREQFDKKVLLDASRYVLGNKLNNLAIIRGFGTNASSRQLERLARSDQIDKIVLGANTGSTVCSGPHQAVLAEKYEKVSAVKFNADHSGDDNIRASAVNILRILRELAQIS